MRRLLARSREVIAQVYRETHGRMPIIGVGGIASAEDAYGHIRAGASLVEFYTGMIYRGPALAREIKRGLVRLLARDGFRSISEAVGSASCKNMSFASPPHRWRRDGFGQRRDTNPRHKFWWTRDGSRIIAATLT